MTAPYYEDDAVTIYHGDGTTLAPSISAKVLITDPPYGTAFYATDVDVAEPLAQLVRSFASAAVFGYPEALVAWCADSGLRPDEWVTWWPTNKTSGHRGKGLARETEHVAVFGSMPGAKTIMRPRTPDSTIASVVASRGLEADQARMGDVWRDPAPGMGFNHRSRLHPNEKPIKVMRRIVTMCSDPGDLILDPFCGSGTTLRAAKDLGRRAIGIEIDERHCETAAKRMTQDVLDVEAA